MTPDARADLADLAERMLQHVLAADPLEATLMGYRQHDAHLADLSVASQEERAADRAVLRDETSAVSTHGLTEQELLTRAVLIALADYADDGDAANTLDFTVAAFPVCPASMLLSYVRMIVLTDAQQADDYLARLSEIPRYLVQAGERLERGRQAGLTPVAHLVQAAIDQIDRFLVAEPNPLAIPAPSGLDHATDGADAWRARLARVLDEEVRPSFAAFRETLLDQALPTARDAESVGLVHLPDGLERYRRLVRVHTTTDRTPEDLHQTGLDIVARIQDEFRELGGRVLGTSDLEEIFARLKDDPSLRWHTSQQILDAAESTVRRAEAAAGDWFGRLPAAVCALEAIPELEAKGAPAAYYMQPALDRSRPGTYFTNVSEPHERTSFDLESVAFHEAVPGHHFQISLALETPELPMIRRLSLFTAYVEGWGLYSERLADEMGLYSSDVQRLGMLSADAWRASRLVVDTGLHAFGWSKQQAVEYMRANTPVAPIEVDAEVDRYIAYPGQALSYMTGRVELERLRAEATRRLGDRFDIKSFHDVVLGAGALPLSLLADVVDAWIARAEGGGDRPAVD